jgi:hypothetical protein
MPLLLAIAELVSINSTNQRFLRVYPWEYKMKASMIVAKIRAAMSLLDTFPPE